MPNGSPRTSMCPRCLQGPGRELSALKQWIYKGKIKTVKTPGGHHRIPEAEIDRLLPAVPQRGPVQARRESFRTISGRNQLVGRIVS